MSRESVQEQHGRPFSALGQVERQFTYLGDRSITVSVGFLLLL
jgi:hypothetical protein